VEEGKIDWLEVLTELCRADIFGHESWFEVGLEQHKQFYYCFIGDGSATSEDAWNLLYEGKPKSESARCFAGRHPKYIDGAVFHALAAAFNFLANLPLFRAEPLEKLEYLDAWWSLLTLEDKERLKKIVEEE